MGTGLPRCAGVSHPLHQGPPVRLLQARALSLPLPRLPGGRGELTTLAEHARQRCAASPHMQLLPTSEHDSHGLSGSSLGAPWQGFPHAALSGPRCCADDVAASPSTRGRPGSQRASPLGHPRAARELLEPGSSSEQSDDEPAAFPQSPATARAPAQAQGGAHNDERAIFPQPPAGTAKAQAQAQAVPGQHRGASTPRRGVRRRLVPGRSSQQGQRSSQGDAEPQARPLTQLQRPAALMRLSPGTDADLQVHPRLLICLPGLQSCGHCRWLPVQVAGPLSSP